MILYMIVYGIVPIALLSLLVLVLIVLLLTNIVINVRNVNKNDVIDINDDWSKQLLSKWMYVMLSLVQLPVTIEF